MTTRLTSKRNDGTVTRTAGRPILPKRKAGIMSAPTSGQVVTESAPTTLNLNIHLRDNVLVSSHVQESTGTGVLRIGPNATLFVSNLAQADAIASAARRLRSAMLRQEVEATNARGEGYTL